LVLCGKENLAKSFFFLINDILFCIFITFSNFYSCFCFCILIGNGFSWLFFVFEFSLAVFDFLQKNKKETQENKIVYMMFGNEIEILMRDG
jgi:hypothetical protein